MNILDVINKHLDLQEGMNSAIKEDIDKIVNAIDLKALVARPDETIDIVMKAIVELIKNEYLHLVVKESQEFASNASKSD